MPTTTSSDSDGASGAPKGTASKEQDTITSPRHEHKQDDGKGGRETRDAKDFSAHAGGICAGTSDEEAPVNNMTSSVDKQPSSSKSTINNLKEPVPLAGGSIEVGASKQPANQILNLLDDRINKKMHQDLVQQPGYRSNEYVSVRGTSAKEVSDYKPQSIGKVSFQDRIEGKIAKESTPKAARSKAEEMASFFDARINRKMQHNLIQPPGSRSDEYTDIQVGNGGDRPASDVVEESLQDRIDRKILEGSNPGVAAEKIVELSDSESSGPPLSPNVQFGDNDQSADKAKLKAYAKVEFHVDSGPPLSAQMQFDEKERKTAYAKTETAGGLSTNHDPPPVPPQMRTSDDEDSMDQVQTSALADSESASPDRVPPNSGQVLETAPALPVNTVQSNSTTTDQGGQSLDVPQDREPNQLKRDPSAFIAEAYLVDEEGRDEIQEEPNEDLVISGYAEPMAPWWKTMTKHFCGFIFCMGAITTIIALSMTIAFNIQDEYSYYGCYNDDYYTSPSNDDYYTSPSVEYLTDMCPSQTLDFDLFETHALPIAADGNDLVVLVEDLAMESTFLFFYNSQGSDDWQEWVIADLVEVDGTVLYHDMAISGNTTLLGVEGSSGWAVYVFERDSLGQWSHNDDVSILTNSTKLTPVHVDLDTDLAIVSDSENVVIFQRVGGQWMHTDTIEMHLVESVSIVGSTIALQGQGNDNNEVQVHLYTYNNVTRSVSSLQESLGRNVMALATSEEHLVFSSCPQCAESSTSEVCTCDGLFAYHRKNSNETFSLLEELDVITQNGIQGLTLDSNVLLAENSEPNQWTYTLFSFEDGRWDKKGTFINNHSMDGHSLLSGGKFISYYSASVRSVELENCDRLVQTSSNPTQAPTPCGVVYYYYYSTGELVGLVIGVVLASLLLIGLCYRTFRRNNRQSDGQAESQLQDTSEELE